jgi:hypothetical protein
MHTQIFQFWALLILKLSDVAAAMVRPEAVVRT